jgi:DNA-binding NarL/FixJ family response regulator
MDNNTRFNTYIQALQQFSSREGHCNVPAVHTEIVDGKEITLGAWVGYVRQRRRKNQLSDNRASELQAVSGWQWGPLKPGPATDADRNQQILQMRAAGSSLRQIADQFDLSRQRVHQIVKKISI